MDDLLASIVCGGGLLGLMGLALLVFGWQNTQRGNVDGYHTLQARCAELEMVLYGVKDERNRLARRVVELEHYLVPYANLLKELAANDRAFAALQHDNADLRKRLDGARVLVLALASKAGVQVDQDPRSGQWRPV